MFAPTLNLLKTLDGYRLTEGASKFDFDHPNKIVDFPHLLADIPAFVYTFVNVS